MLNMKLDRITVNPRRMNGQPCIRDLRLTVRRVLELTALYPDRLELKQEYPELTDEDIRQALIFAATALDDRVVGTIQVVDGKINLPPNVVDWVGDSGKLSLFVTGDTLILKRFRAPKLSEIAARVHDEEMPLDEIVDEAHRYRQEQRTHEKSWGQGAGRANHGFDRTRT